MTFKSRKLLVRNKAPDMGIASSAVDLFYGAKRARTSFELLNPDEPVLLYAACKARRPAGENLATGWAFSRRNSLLVTERRMLCGDWDIPLAEVERVTYNAFNGVTSRGMVLTVWMRNGDSYQFGLNKSEKWLESFPTEIQAEDTFGQNGLVIWVIRAGLAILIFKEFF